MSRVGRHDASASMDVFRGHRMVHPAVLLWRRSVSGCSLSSLRGLSRILRKERETSHKGGISRAASVAGDTRHVLAVRNRGCALSRTKTIEHSGLPVTADRRPIARPPAQSLGAEAVRSQNSQQKHACTAGLRTLAPLLCLTLMSTNSSGEAHSARFA